MDRRNFLKTILSVSLVSPFASASSIPQSRNLFLISDEPQIFLPPLLPSLIHDHSLFSFAFLNPHLQQKKLTSLFKSYNWTLLHDPSKADVVLSSTSLSVPCRPSFTYVRNGAILDLRSAKLLSLWTSMASLPHSSNLTSIALRPKASFRAGQFVSVFVTGRQVDRIPLTDSFSRCFAGARGQVEIRMEKGKAWVAEASCAHKICCSHPPVSLPGERIICAPSQILLNVSAPDSIDTSIG